MQLALSDVCDRETPIIRRHLSNCELDSAEVQVSAVPRKAFPLDEHTSVPDASYFSA